MNLGPFNIEFEPATPEHKPQAVSAPRGNPHRWRDGRLLVAVALTCTAGLAGWIGAGGDFTDLPALPWDSGRTKAAPAETVMLSLSTIPVGADVWVDGESVGTTPLHREVRRGRHGARLALAGFAEQTWDLTLDEDLAATVPLWSLTPVVRQLRPPYPGGAIRDGHFLSDGRLALTISRQAGELDGSIVEPWLLNSNTGALTRVDYPVQPGRVGAVAVAPNGQDLALATSNKFGNESGSRAGPTEVWVTWSKLDGVARRVFALAIESTAGKLGTPRREEITDLVWTPDNLDLLIVTGYAPAAGLSGAPRARILRVDLADEHSVPQELLVLPAEVVPGSWNWAPDGQWGAFLAASTEGAGSARRLALCALNIDVSGTFDGFRYIADLGPAPDPAKLLPVAPLAWAPGTSGHLAYVASTVVPTVSNPLGLPNSSASQPALFIATPAAPALGPEIGRRLGSASGIVSRAWPVTPGLQADVVALSRAENGDGLLLRGYDATTGAVRGPTVELPKELGASGALAVRWDLARGRALVIQRPESPGAASQFWLLQLRAPDPDATDG